MDQFYFRNAARYHSLVEAATLKPIFLTQNGSQNTVVSVRIRPLATDEEYPSAIYPRLEQGQKNVLDVHDLVNHPSGTPRLRSYNYEVDNTFGVGTATEQIYGNCVAELVDFASSGGVTTLFVYGQTGSGKTFTVSELQQLVAKTLLGANSGTEVYMTTIDLVGNSAFDLLNGRTSVRLLDDFAGVTQMVGATEHRVNRLEEMEELIEQAGSYRRTAATLKNDASSRSHAICRIRIKNPVNPSEGLLYMVDLAGSESARDVAEHGKVRMRETREINVSLSILNDCIRSKAKADEIASSSTRQKPPRIPIRQSYLTRVLKHVFDPDSSRECRTVVIACINPSLADVAVSRNTLRYAELLRNPIPVTDFNPERLVNWSNERVQQWIRENVSCWDARARCACIDMSVYDSANSAAYSCSARDGC